MSCDVFHMSQHIKYWVTPCLRVHLTKMPNHDRSQLPVSGFKVDWVWHVQTRQPEGAEMLKWMIEQSGGGVLTTQQVSHQLSHYCSPTTLHHCCTVALLHCCTMHLLLAVHDFCSCCYLLSAGSHLSAPAACWSFNCTGC